MGFTYRANYFTDDNTIKKKKSAFADNFKIYNTIKKLRFGGAGRNSAI